MDDKFHDLCSVSPSSAMCIDGNEYTFANPLPQYFSLPMPIIQCVIDNPTPKVWKKLIQRCKFFFSKKPIVPVKSIREGFVDGVYAWNRKYAAMWLYDYLDYSPPFRLPSLLTCKVQFEMKVVHLALQDLSIDEFYVLTRAKTIRSITLYLCSISYPDASPVPCDKLFVNLENAYHVRLTFAKMVDPFGGDTGTKIAKILPRMKALKSIILEYATTSFQATPFIQTMLALKHIRVQIMFDNPLPDEYFVDMNESFVKLFKHNRRILLFNYDRVM